MSSRECKETAELQQGVIFAILKDGNILLQKRLNPEGSYFGLSIVPGGKVEEGEDKENALKREIKEETGLNATSFRSLKTIQFTTPKGNNYLHNIYLITGFSGDLEKEKEKGVGLFYWASMEQARLDCEHPKTQEILDIIEDSLIE